MAHIFFIDPLEKLTIKKDSSLILALALQQAGEDVRFLFEKDFHYSNKNQEILSNLFSFNGDWERDGFHLKRLDIEKEERRPFCSKDTLHMRLEPPFNKRYLSYLWMLQGIQKKTGMAVINSPEGLLLYNEKLFAYQLDGTIDSFVGSTAEEFSSFAEQLRERGFEEIVLKPLELYQGEGVEKLSLGNPQLVDHFLQKAVQSAGPIVAQPFIPDIYTGEIRSVFFCGRELGNLLKVPPEGEFLSTVSRGAHCHPVQLSSKQYSICEQTALYLQKQGVHWIAFDILGDSIQEVNITCPGLLPEISQATGKPLVETMVAALLAIDRTSK